MTQLNVRVFTRDDPCTKKDIHNTFAVEGGYARRPVVEAWGVMGKQAIRNMLSKGYARQVSEGNVDYWELTPEGEEWLRKGVASFVKNNPDQTGELNHYGDAPVKRRRRRTSY